MEFGVDSTIRSKNKPELKYFGLKKRHALLAVLTGLSVMNLPTVDENNLREKISLPNMVVNFSSHFADVNILYQRSLASYKGESFSSVLSVNPLKVGSYRIEKWFCLNGRDKMDGEANSYHYEKIFKDPIEDMSLPSDLCNVRIFYSDGVSTDVMDLNLENRL
ncbi:MAG: hypothetical protein KC589_08100 [Nanoarchaeota archaeon]|nr:hypothetical protein [Nanoarchaeota archaeon]